MSPYSKDFKTPYFEKKGLKFPARIVSIIFHPVFVTFYTALLIYWLQRPLYISITNKYPFWLGYLFINLVLFPVITSFLLKKLGFISSMTMTEPKDRIIPLIATMIFYFWAYNVAKNLTPEVPLYMRVYLLGAFWGVIVTFLVNIFFKVSMHTMAIGATIGILIVMILVLRVDILWIIAICILLAGLIGSVRLILKAHFPFELLLGYILGFMVQVAAYYFLK